MGDLPFIFWIFGIVGAMAAISIIFLLLKNIEQLDQEKTQPCLAQLRLAGFLGGLYFKGPFIKVRVYRDFFVCGVLRPHLIPYSEIEEVIPPKKIIQFGHRIVFKDTKRKPWILSITPEDPLMKRLSELKLLKLAS